MTMVSGEPQDRLFSLFADAGTFFAEHTPGILPTEAHVVVYLEVPNNDAFLTFVVLRPKEFIECLIPKLSREVRNQPCLVLFMKC